MQAIATSTIAFSDLSDLDCTFIYLICCQILNMQKSLGWVTKTNLRSFELMLPDQSKPECDMSNALFIIIDQFLVFYGLLNKTPVKY